MPSTGALLAVLGVAGAILLAGEGLGRRALVLAAKPVASACLLVLGWSRWEQGDAYGAWIVVGLFASFWGDVLLMFPRAFLAGLVAFLLAHVAYLAAFHAALPAASWPVFLAAPVLAGSVLATRWLWPHLGRLRRPVLAYVAVITLMVWGAVAAAAAGVRPPWVAAGAVLFYLSDLAVARDRFVARAFVNRAWGLPAYFAGQVLLALSVGA